MRFRVAFAIVVDRQLLPLTTQIQDLQNVVEDLVKTQLRCRTSATDGEMRQDKLLELRQLQLRRKRLPALLVWTAPGGIECARLRSLLLISDKGDRPWNRFAELGWIRRSMFFSFMG